MNIQSYGSKWSFEQQHQFRHSICTISKVIYFSTLTISFFIIFIFDIVEKYKNENEFDHDIENCLLSPLYKYL